MNAIIRPAWRVFARDLPLMVVFDAFVPDDAPLRPSLATDLALRDAIATARGYRWPLAFWRRLDPRSAPPEGHWRPGCRPRVTDRVFEGPGTSPFDNREFRQVVAESTKTDLFAIGLADDSARETFARRAAMMGRRVVLVTDTQVLQNCSASDCETRATGPEFDGHEPIRRLCVENWKYSMRALE